MTRPHTTLVALRRPAGAAVNKRLRTAADVSAPLTWQELVELTTHLCANRTEQAALKAAADAERWRDDPAKLEEELAAIAKRSAVRLAPPTALRRQQRRHQLAAAERPAIRAAALGAS